MMPLLDLSRRLRRLPAPRGQRGRCRQLSVRAGTMESDEDSLEAPVRDEDISDLPPCEAGGEEYDAACAAGKNPWCPKTIPLGTIT